MYRTALVMIVKNEARSIQHCLRQVRPWVDEMIVLDTGSADNTVALAQAEGAQVHHFKWVDDFAAARNAALSLSHADWHIVLDADETLVEGGPVLQALKHQKPNFIGRIDVCSSYAGHQGQTQLASSWLPRVLPAAVRYTGRIHEQPDAPGLPRRDLPVKAMHDGYMPAQMKDKGARNQQLLERMVQSHPHDPYWRYQLGKDHEVHDRFTQALAQYDAALQQLGPSAGREPPWRHDLVLRSLFTMKVLGQIDRAIHLAEAEMPNWPDSPDYFFVLGDVLLEMAILQPAQARDIIPMIDEAWQRCLSIGENPLLEGAVHGRGSFLAQHNLNALHKTLVGPLLGETSPI